MKDIENDIDHCFICGPTTRTDNQGAAPIAADSVRPVEIDHQFIARHSDVPDPQALARNNMLGRMRENASRSGASRRSGD
ncbi:MAG: hypothetical protein B7X08_01710 [Acidocella sp. 20-63-7]|nr:MAG: hypothetical protein B7X08_01710 [Acidocella sp. 20-63-7]